MKLYGDKELVAEQVGDRMIFNKEVVQSSWYLSMLFKWAAPDFTPTVSEFNKRFVSSRCPEKGSEDEAFFFKYFKCKTSYELAVKGNAKMIQDKLWVDFGDGEVFFGVSD